MDFSNNLYLEGREESFAVLKSSIDVEGEHPRMAKLLPLRQLVLGVAGKAWTPQNLVAFFFTNIRLGTSRKALGDAAPEIDRLPEHFVDAPPSSPSVSSMTFRTGICFTNFTHLLTK